MTGEAADSKQVTVVDYGIGNIFSVSRAIEHFGFSVQLTDRPEDVLRARRLVLPGVGAFSNGMRGLRERGLVEALREYATTGRPLLGICLGMQMMLSESEEFGSHKGLDLIPGRVVPVVGRDANGMPLKVPHIGWSSLKLPASRRSWDGSVLEGLAAGSHAYFVHSYMGVPDNDAHRLADTCYGDCRIAAAIQKGSISGCQFHPEKSAGTGLHIVRNFLLGGS